MKLRLRIYYRIENCGWHVNWVAKIRTIYMILRFIDLIFFPNSATRQANYIITKHDKHQLDAQI